MFSGVLRVFSGFFGLLGISLGIYEMLKGEVAGAYDFGGGIIWGILFLAVTAYINKQNEIKQIEYQGQQYQQ